MVDVLQWQKKVLSGGKSCAILFAFILFSIYRVAWLSQSRLDIHDVRPFGQKV